MKQICRILSIAALVIVGALACTKLNRIPGQAGNDAVAGNGAGTVTLTTTITLDGGTQTRALDAAGHKTFTKDDQIAVIYYNTKSKALKAVSNPLTDDDISDGGKTAKITVTLSEPGGYANLRLIYPAAMAKATIDEDAAINDDAGTIDYTRLAAQDGTINYISANLDLATYDGSLTLDAKLPTTKMTLTNRLAIGEFTIKNSGGTDITSDITSLAVDDGSNTYTISRSAFAGHIYVAMRPVASEQNIYFNATTSTENYIKTVKSGHGALKANNMYPVNLTMTQQKTVSLAALSADYVAQDGDVLTGTLDGTTQKYKISIAAGATVTLSNATINGVNTDDSHELWAGLTCLGDATIILDGTNAVQNFNRNYSGLQPGPTGTTLTIRGSGSLTAKGQFGAGIGTKYDGGSCGNIRIEGGTITAKSVNNGAGIGSSYNSTCGDITITGSAQVTASGGISGAGIGSGRSGNSGTSQCHDITISGSAQVTANGGIEGAGIGSGTGSYGTAQCHDITISGGTVLAKGGSNATGIGSGTGSYGTAQCGNISITRGTGFVSVTAIRGSGASKSIGTSYGNNNDEYKCGRITFDEEVIFNGYDDSYDAPGDGDYGDLHFAKTTTDDGTDDTDNTWTLTPKP